MNLQAILEEFSRLLQERFARRVFTTEDTIRYTCYAAMTSVGGIPLTDLTLEYPHPRSEGKRIDTVVAAGDGRPSMAVEFKYDRSPPGGKNAPLTQRAAGVVNDLLRLAHVPGDLAEERYVVYVTDQQMAGYFGNPRNGLDRLFRGEGAAGFPIRPDVFAGRAKTLTDRIGDLLCSCDVRVAFAADLGSDHIMRVFHVSEAHPSAPTPARPLGQSSVEG